MLRCYAKKEAPAQAVAVTAPRNQKLTPSPGGNLPSNRYLTHCSYSLQHRICISIVIAFIKKARGISRF